MPLLGLDSRKLASLGWRPRTAMVDGLDRMLRSLESAPPFAGPLL
jgi:nucleoside-diphosphate-sugar epimerase